MSQQSSTNNSDSSLADAKQIIPLHEPCFMGKEWEYVKDCLDSRWVSSVGGYVTEFEKRIAEYTDSRFAVATVNGTAALHTALLVAEIQSGDEVIAPTLSFIAPINAAKYVGASPVFMDCDSHLNIDPEKTVEFCEKECVFDGKYLINRKTNAKIKAILVVHVFGHPVNIEPLMTLAEKYKLILIEDAAESLGSSYTKEKYANKFTGTVGHIGCYSFNGNKIITTGGGGMILTNNDAYAKKARYLTTQAKDDPENFIHNEVGYNYRLTSIQAALGCAQLEQLEHFIDIKRRNFDIYHKRLSKIERIRLVEEPAYAKSNYWLYTLKLDRSQDVEKRNTLLKELKNEGVQSRPLWELNHRQKPYSNCQTYKIENAVILHRTCINLPSSPSLNENQIQHICDVIERSI